MTIYSPGGDWLSEVQFHMSTSCQPGSQVIRALSNVKNLFLFSDLAVKTAKSKNKKAFSTSEKGLGLAAG